MAGIQSLMQAPQGQGQMPGQAPQQPMPGMMPQQGAPTPGAMTGSLKNMPLEQLRALYQNPQPGNPPLWAVISALAEKQKEAQAMMAAQGQSAMAQNAQMQQQPPVAAQVVQAAEQMEPQGYAGGGAVAFTNGGDIAVQRILQKSPYERTPQENEILRAAGIEVAQRTLPQEGGVSALNRMLESPFLRRMFTGDTYKLSPEELAKRTDTGASTEKLFRGMGGQQYVEPSASTVTDTGDELARLRNRGILTPTPAPTGTRPAGPRPTGGQRQAQRPATNMDVGALMSPVEVTGTAAPAGAGLAALEAADVEAAQKRLTQDPEVKAAQEALLKRMQTTEESRRSRAQQQLDEVLKRGRTSVFEDPEALLRIAAGIDTRKGKGIGSLAGGVSGVMGERRKEAADARTLFNKEMDALSTMEQLRLERDLLIKQGRITEAQAAEDKLRAVRREYEGIRYNREVKQREEERQQFVAQSGRMSAEASVRQADAAARRAAAAGTEKPITPYQLAQLRDKARDNLKDTLPMIIREAKRKAQAANVPFDPQAAEDAAIKREMERLMPGLSGEKPAPAPAPGQLSPELLSQFKVSPVGQ